MRRRSLGLLGIGSLLGVLGTSAAPGIPTARPTARAQEAQSNQSLAGLLAPRPAPPASLDPELDVMARKLDALARRFSHADASEDAQARSSITLGRTAIAAARAALLDQHPEQAAGKKRIAQAALELASRIAARIDEMRAEAAAKNRVKLAQEARDLAAAALAQAEERRATLQAEPQ